MIVELLLKIAILNNKLPGILISSNNKRENQGKSL